MPSKRARQKRRKRRDWTRPGARPVGRPASAPRPRGGFFLLIAVVMIGLGVVVGVFATRDLAVVSGRTGSPVLRMTVDSCRYDHQGRGQTTVCEGHGDPAGSGMTAGRWEIPSADHFYDAGAVVSVRCSGADDCVEPGVHAIANDAVGILLGVGFTAGGVLCAFAGLAERLPSERLDPFSTRRRKLAVFGFGALGVLMASLTAVWAVT